MHARLAGGRVGIIRADIISWPHNGFHFEMGSVSIRFSFRNGFHFDSVFVSIQLLYRFGGLSPTVDHTSGYGQKVDHAARVGQERSCSDHSLWYT